MYAITMQIYAARWPQINTEIYEKLAQTYHLPSLDDLVNSLEDKVVEWSSVDKTTQVYYLENLREASRHHVFQVRFKSNTAAREPIALFVSVDDKRLAHNMTLTFPSHGDRHCSARIIGWLKDMQKSPGGATVEFEVAGYGERESLRYIREHSLSSFQWHEELNRYLHVTDHPNEVKETKKGMTR